ncbi:Bug family tripartite tricarboxylate transporter substrate binding protein [Pseudorhodoferax soli]|uniref:Tripartite-type tricarboxylate transporter receptor subunit TctC n=1 Tax=Pseudorhodoferax soli TaxID=545864 RepID=A0A368XQ21_9BURK|nr:tripartite tricarboxylate transporter substrate binding protein [Pseudorhodoferax soli]RCW68607.1 tripartite-type tricarboxylate transporter receptor subunit TctC [Pseudorhodoferax soli]
MNRTKRLLVALVACAAGTSFAQHYPEKAIRLLVPTSTGTASDLTARFVSEELGKMLGVAVAVDNRAGANGVLATQTLLGAPADGHTLMVMASGLYANPALYKNLTYDPGRDQTIVAPLNQAYFALVAGPSFDVTSVKELVERAKKQPGEVTYGSASVGSSTHLAPELFALRAGITLRHIPYKGGAQAITDTAGGQVNIAMTAVPTAIPLITAGKLKALAVSAANRSALLPDVPTFAESGIRGAEFVSRQSIVVRTGTPEAVVTKLRQAILKITSTAEYARFLSAQGLEKETAPLDAYLKSGPEETVRWAEMVRISGVKQE